MGERMPRRTARSKDGGEGAEGEDKEWSKGIRGLKTRVGRESSNSREGKLYSGGIKAREDGKEVTVLR